MLIILPKEYTNGYIYGTWDNEKMPIELDQYDFQLKDYNFYKINLPHDYKNTFINFRMKINNLYFLSDELSKFKINQIDYNQINIIGKYYHSNNIKYCIIEDIFKLYIRQLLILECSVPNGLTNYLPNGFYIEYYDNNMPSFRGNIKHGTISGVCSEYYQSGFLKYQGNCLNRVKNGFGIEYHKNKNKLYEGMFMNDKYHGKGIKYNETGVKQYEGEFENNKYNKYGKLFNDNGVLIYEGSFLNGLFHGSKGKEYNDKGILKYDGDFINNFPHGSGNQYNDKGKLIYHGNFSNGFYSGKGTLIDQERERVSYIGEFKDGLKHGMGIEFNPQTGYKIFEGEFINNIPKPSKK
jgi:hypothetical protein